MMGRLTNELEQFLDNNSPGGYVQTTINISSDDLSSRIQTILNNKNYLTSTSHIPYSQIDGTPTLADVAYSGEYGELKHLPELAPVATSGDYNDLRNKPTNSGIPAGGIPYESIAGRPNLATVATSGLYKDLVDIPEFAEITKTGDFEDLVNVPDFVKRDELEQVAFSGKYADLDFGTAEIGASPDEIIYNFDIRETSCEPLKYLSDRLVDTTQLLQNDVPDYMVENFLLDLIDIYFNVPEHNVSENDNSNQEINLNQYKSPVLIKLTTFLGDIVLTGLRQQNESFIFTFTSLDMNTYLLVQKTQEHALGNEEQGNNILSDLIPSYFYPILIFTPTKHELWIKRMTMITRNQLADVATSGKYDDLDGTPQLATVAKDGSFYSLIDYPRLQPVATTGKYADLIGKPTYQDIDGIPNLATVATTGKYDDLDGTPHLEEVAKDGSFYSLVDYPHLKDIAKTGSFNDLEDKPELAILKVFDVSNFNSALLKTFSSGEINTTGLTTNNNDAITINNWLQEIIDAYKQSNKLTNNVIKIKNNTVQLILTYIENNNNIFIFHFTPISEHNLQQLINNDEQITENNIIFLNYAVHFVYDKNKDKLYIYKQNVN